MHNKCRRIDDHIIILQSPESDYIVEILSESLKYRSLFCKVPYIQLRYLNNSGDKTGIRYTLYTSTRVFA